MNWLFASLVLLLQTPPPEKPAPPVELKKLDYFLGTWLFEWNVPDSPLGPGGKIEGNETFKKTLNGFFYESEIESNGPLGPFQARSIMGYNEVDRAYTRYEFDSQGVAILKTGPMGGDAGGWNTIYWESSPIVRNGKSVRLKGSTHMYSPVNYRLRLLISIDGSPYKNYGNPWFRKLGESK